MGKITQDSTKQDYSYLDFTLKDDDTYSVKINANYKNSITEVIIPSTYNGKKVTTIPQEAFYGCNSLKTVNIPSSVIEIGNYAFYGIGTLSEVTFDDPNNWYAIWAGNKEDYSSKVSDPVKMAEILKVMNYSLLKISE